MYPIIVMNGSSVKMIGVGGDSLEQQELMLSLVATASPLTIMADFL